MGSSPVARLDMVTEDPGLFEPALEKPLTSVGKRTSWVRGLVTAGQPVEFAAFAARPGGKLIAVAERVKGKSTRFDGTRTDVERMVLDDRGPRR